MTQESWKYLINGSYVMLASLCMPIYYKSLINGYQEIHTFLWIFGLMIWVDGTIRIRWFFEISGFYWLLPVISLLIIVIGSIIVTILARMIKQGKKVKKWIFTVIIFLQISMIIVNFVFYEFQVFFGYLSFLFGLILLIIGNKKFLKEQSTNSKNNLEL
jgi:hypothetical protein